MKKRFHGVSLTELMVATTLLATVTAGGLAALSRAQAARREAGVLQQLHERAQYVFATLEPELQMAGYFGTGAAPGVLPAGSVPATAQRCGPDLVRRLDLPLQVEASWTLPCAPQGGGSMTGPQVLIVRRASARLAANAQRGRAQWLSHKTDPAQCGLYWQGEAPWTPTATSGQELRELILRIYYVARSADGEPRLPALRVKSLTSIAGTPAFVDTEVMNGVEDLQVELLPSPTAPRTARVRLRVRADAGGVRAGAAPRTLDVARHFTLRNTAG